MNPKNSNKSLKQRFDQRELPVSENAWERMEDLLTSSGHRQSRKKYGLWMWSAAAVVVTLGIGVYFQTLSSAGPTLSDPGIVSEEQDAPILGTPETFSVPVQENSTKRPVVQTTEIEEVEESKEPVVLIEKSVVDTNTRTKIVVTPVEEHLSATPKLQDQIDAEVDRLLAQFETPEAITSATDAEVDSLLRAAQEHIVFREIQDRSTEALASSLLEHVETELDQTFKDQVFEALRTSFVKAKNAVVMNED